MRTRSIVAKPARHDTFTADSGDGWEIVRDTLTRDYTVYVGGEYVGSRETLSEAQRLRESV
jgi:hypothetical protein